MYIFLFFPSFFSLPPFLFPHSQVSIHPFSHVLPIIALSSIHPNGPVHSVFGRIAENKRDKGNKETCERRFDRRSLAVKPQSETGSGPNMDGGQTSTPAPTGNSSDFVSGEHLHIVQNKRIKDEK